MSMKWQKSEQSSVCFIFQTISPKPAPPHHPLLISLLILTQKKEDKNREG